MHLLIMACWPWQLLQQNDYHWCKHHETLGGWTYQHPIIGSIHYHLATSAIAVHRQPTALISCKVCTCSLRNPDTHVLTLILTAHQAEGNAEAAAAAANAAATKDPTKFSGKKSKAAAKKGTAATQWQILKQSGIPEEEIPQFRCVMMVRFLGSQQQECGSRG